MRLPTVKILREDVEVIINESDYDPKVHKLVGETENEEKPLTEMTVTEIREYAKENDIDVKGLKSKEDLLAAVQPKTETDLFVVPNADGKFIIITADGQAVGEEVYNTQEEAEAALKSE